MHKLYNYIVGFVAIIAFIIGATYFVTGIYCFLTWDWVVMKNVIHWFNPATQVGMRVLYIAIFFMWSFLWYHLNEMSESTTDEEVIYQFLKMNFTGVPQSEEHLNFVKEIGTKLK
jgi:hypothetical protein